MTAPFTALGGGVLRGVAQAGAIALFLFKILQQMVVGRRSRQFVSQCAFVGVESIPIVLLTSFFTGAVLALQSFNGLNAGLNGGGEAIATSQLGNLVATSMLRELGPVLASLMLASRVGAAMAAELGTMRVTEQIDALETLATNPVRYLVVPRILACTMMLPLLVILGNIMGIFGGYVVTTQVLDIAGRFYIDSVMLALTNDAQIMAIVKSIAFGFVVGLMATFHGFNARGGAAGVGEATTKGVVYASVTILIVDYFITAWL
ncbi:MAG: ABC transporter permease [Alphaproteobacteria bacterium]|nr:MAG: ABC transporter permease [Alphaproteobacteria bacterium]